MGGWTNVATQSTLLTPAVVRDAVSVIPKFKTEFNDFLKEKKIPLIRFGRLVGSTAYTDFDPIDKIYGDIDIMFEIPRHKTLSEGHTEALYKELVVEFIKQNSPTYLLPAENHSGQNLLVKLDDESVVQIDLIMAFADVIDWATARVTPQHGLKGAFIGFLYASLASLLHLSIGPRGVQVKEDENGMPVPFANRKNKNVKTISTSTEDFILDILHYVALKNGAKYVIVDGAIEEHKGINANDIQIADLITSIKALSESFAANNLYGSGVLSGMNSPTDFLTQLQLAYIAKADKAAMSSKFDKAESAETKKKAEDFKILLQTKSREIAKQFID